MLNTHGLIDKFVEERWPLGKTDYGKREIERCKRVYERWLEAAESTSPTPEDTEEEAETAFVLEEHLRDYLARNLLVLEPGLLLWPVTEGKNAVEFSVDENNRRIDILAKDHDGIPVVIELKLHRGHERALGQALYYRARVRNPFNVDGVRIIFVGEEITAELREAASQVQDVNLFEYRLSFNVRKA